MDVQLSLTSQIREPETPLPPSASMFIEERAKGSGILSTSPDLPHKVPVGMELQYVPVGGETCKVVLLGKSWAMALLLKVRSYAMPL